MKAAVNRVNPAPGPEIEAIDSILGTRDEPLAAHHQVSDEFRPYVRIVEQALRLGALFHDLGHLPFSHDFEHALEELWRELEEGAREESPMRRLLEKQATGDKPHERLGHALSLLLLQDLFRDLPGEIKDAATVTFRLAHRILEVSELVVTPMFPEPDEAEAVLQWLNSILAGDVDVDRCDYVLRDGRNYGFVFANYDLDRLIDNIVVASPLTGDTKATPPLVLATLPHGISAVESFLIARFRSYQHSVRHHKVAQVGAALRHSILKLLKPPHAGEDNTRYREILLFLRDLDQVMDLADRIKAGDPPPRATVRELLNRFAGYDDAWWSRLMRAAAGADDDEWMALVCWREGGPVSLWKWRAQFSDTAPLRDENLSLQSWNAMLPKKGEDDKKAAWFAAVNDLERDGVLVVRHTHSPWEVSSTEEQHSRLSVLEAPGRLTALTKVSPLIRTLRDAWMDDVQVQAFATSTSPLREDQNEVVRRLTAAIMGKIVPQEEN